MEYSRDKVGLTRWGDGILRDKLGLTRWGDGILRDKLGLTRRVMEYSQIK